jgi:hypothetical protein
MPRVLPPLGQAWDEAIERYASIDPPHFISQFNVTLLEALRPRWEGRLRVNTSMYRLMFTRPDEHHYDQSTTEWVSAELRREDQVELALMRRKPRRGLDLPGGEGVVTGAFTKPTNVLPALEALLMQLSIDG